MRPLWAPIPRIAGPAYPVRNEPADNLMLHIAIHRAPPGAVLVCQAGDHDFAQAGGNVCAWAQKRGIAGMVVDGAVRDVGESRENGVAVAPGDMVIADEEGIVVLPGAKAEDILRAAAAKAEKDAATRLEDWVAAHKKTIDDLVKKLGIDG